MKRIIFILLLIPVISFSQKRDTLTLVYTSNPNPLPDMRVRFQSGTNMSESPANNWYATDGNGNWCGYSTSYLPASEAGYYYAEYNSLADNDNVFIALSSAVLSSCEIVFDGNLRYAVFPDDNQGFYRVRDGVAGSFTTTSVVPTVGDLFGIFREAGGTVTAQYYRSGTWTVMHTYSSGSTANLYFSAEGLIQNPNPCILQNPKSSPNQH